MRRLIIPNTLWIAILFFSACAPASNNSISENGCIAPITDFSYAIKNPESQQIKVITAPQGKWVVETSTPTVPDKAMAYTRLAFSREFNANTEVWLIRWTRSISNQPQFLVYESSSQSWEVIDRPYSNEIDPDTVETILLDEDQSIWAVLWAGNSVKLLKFNESNRSFDAYSENHIDTKIKTAFSLLDSPNVFSNNGVLWRLQSNRLDRFDPSTGEIQQYQLDVGNAIVDKNNNAVHYAAALSAVQDDVMAFGLQDTVYMLSASSPELLEYHLENGQLIRKIIPVITEEIGLESANYFDNPPLPGQINGNSLFIDNAGNLWVNDFGWMEPDGAWNVILRSPVFIREQIEVMKYLWYRPEIVFQSTDNTLWFRSPNGLVALDVAQGKWCWTTQALGNILEDANRNLWMIADEKLYKNPLGEQ